MKKVIFLITVVLALVLVSCGKKETFGKEVSGNATTTVSEILKSPDSFKEKEVVIEGKIGDVCPSGCWFYLKDENAAANQLYIDIAPAGIAIPQKSGSKARLSGTVKYDGKSVIIYGNGVEL